MPDVWEALQIIKELLESKPEPFSPEDNAHAIWLLRNKEESCAFLDYCSRSDNKLEKAVEYMQYRLPRHKKPASQLLHTALASALEVYPVSYDSRGNAVNIILRRRPSEAQVINFISSLSMDAGVRFKILKSYLDTLIETSKDPTNEPLE